MTETAPLRRPELDGPLPEPRTPPGEEPSAEEPSTGRPPADATSAQRSPAERSPVERSPAERLPAGARREPLWRHLVGERLRHVRHERGETLDETARRAGISPQYLSEVERGVKEPSSEMIAAITGALDLTLVDLVSAVADRLVTVGGGVAVRGPVRQVTCQAAFALAA